MRRRVLIGAVLAGVGVAGWWLQWQTDDEGSVPSERERIAAIDTVTSVERAPAHPYEITVEAGTTTDQISDLLAEASSILSSTDHVEAYPMMWVKVDDGEVYVDLSAEPEITAAIVNTTASTIMASFEMKLTGDSFSQFTFKKRDEVLARARSLLFGFDEAGVEDFGPMGVLQFSHVSRLRRGPLLELDPAVANVAVDRIDRLVRSLRRSGTDLVHAELGDGDQVIEVAAPNHSRVDPVADVFADAYGKRQLQLTIKRGTVTPDGLVMPLGSADPR